MAACSTSAGRSGWHSAVARDFILIFGVNRQAEAKSLLGTDIRETRDHKRKSEPSWQVTSCCCSSTKGPQLLSFVCCLCEY